MDVACSSINSVIVVYVVTRRHSPYTTHIGVLLEVPAPIPDEYCGDSKTKRVVCDAFMEQKWVDCIEFVEESQVSYCQI
jgi:hypothetical protein